MTPTVAIMRSVRRHSRCERFMKSNCLEFNRSLIQCEQSIATVSPSLARLNILSHPMQDQNSMNFRLSIALALLGLLPCAAAQAAAPGALLLNEANTVSGGVYLEKGKSDPALGRLEGNGQNWINFIVAGNDPSKHTVDLRGWEM